MNVFITGIAGFMGSHLAEYLTLQGHNVMGMDNYFHASKKEVIVPHYKEDIRDQKFLHHAFYREKIDIVLHLAAQIHVDYSIKYPQETLDINVKGTANILEECKRYGIKCLVASTSEIYGSSQTKYMSELHPLDCQSPYGASKVAADRLAKSYIDTYDQNIVVIRNFNAFGPYQNDGSYGSVIARFTKAALTNEPLYIYGDGSQERDYMYIDDIIRAYEFAMKMPRGIYNFGTGDTQTVLEMANRITILTKSKSPIIKIESRAGEVQRLCCDIGKVSKLGWKPITDFDRDLKKYIKWFTMEEVKNGISDSK